MEVINNATESISPLAQLRGRKEALMAKLDKENSRTQDIIRKQNSMRQTVMLFCVLGAFCALCSCLICMAKDTIFKNVYLPFSIVMIILAVVFLFLAIKNYPASVKYKGNWKNYKTAPTYEEVLKKSLDERKKTRDIIHSLNTQLEKMDGELDKKIISDNNQ